MVQVVVTVVVAPHVLLVQEHANSFFSRLGMFLPQFVPKITTARYNIKLMSVIFPPTFVCVFFSIFLVSCLVFSVCLGGGSFWGVGERAGSDSRASPRAAMQGCCHHSVALL